jgi:hypothetical protein
LFILRAAVRLSDGAQGVLSNELEMNIPDYLFRCALQAGLFSPRRRTAIMSESTKYSGRSSAFKEVQMRKTVFAGLIAAMTLAAASAAQAAPAASLPAGVAADHGAVTQVYWRGHWGHWGGYHRWGYHRWGGWGYRRWGWRWGYHRHWHCWWVNGYRHCRWW